MLRRIHLVMGVIAITALSVVGCSRYQKEQRAEWRSQAEKACMRTGSVRESQHVRIAKTLEGPGSCGADLPLRVSAFTMDNMDVTASAPSFGNSSLRNPASGFVTKLNQESTMNCPMYSAVDRWLEQVVQPASMSRFGQPVVELRIMGTYSCRRMNNGRASARMSEHSFANAIDVGGFRLADGSIITVLKGWKGGQEEQNFLREVHSGACSNFATVLGPGADAFHYDHFHFDLARHGSGRNGRGENRSICRPNPQAVPPPNEGFPINPAPSPMMSSRTNGNPLVPAETYASTTRALPAYRPAQLPGAPRNPVAERDEAALRTAPPRAKASGNGSDKPIMLYGQGRGPFLPLPENEIDPEDLDAVTGSIGE
jgi:hypothetical protein